MKPQLKRPYDPIARAKLVGDIATGQVVDEVSNAPATKDYAELDAAILAQIQAGHRTFKALCDAIEETPYIVIDRRLEVLRKAKKISYGPHGWLVRS